MKTIIISPRCSGKTTFVNKNESAYCGEYLSSILNFTKGFKMGAHAATVPDTHPYYKSWDEIHKIGIQEFWGNSKYKNKFLLLNGAGIVDWIKRVYFWDCGPNNVIVPQKGISLKIVLVDEDLHYKYFLNKMNSDERYNSKLKDLLIQSNSITQNLYNWEYIKSERKIYQNLSKTYNIPVFNTFEEACK